MKKKSSIIYVFKFLQSASSEKNPISQLTMAKTLKLMGIKCDRKTIARDIEVLISCGYNIIKIKNRGCYLVKDFSETDINYLINGIHELDMPIDEKNELIKKVKKL